MALDQVDVDQLKLGDGQDEPEKEMSFLEHLEELRWHVIRSLIAIAVIGIVLFIFNNWFFDQVIFGPRHEDFISYRIFCRLADILHLGGALCFAPPEFIIQTVGVGEAFINSIKVSFIAGFVLSFPYIFYEIWRFISPGLYPKEQKAARGMVLICSLLFFTGVCFGYFIVSPFAIKFLVGYTIPGVVNSPTLVSLVNYMVMFTAPAGLIFELPVVVYFLSKIGLVTPELMREYRRHSIIGILAMAAILTPPDVVTQFLIGIPLYILYEASIFISRRVQKQNEKEMA
ncbi:MAG: Sec-independent protein translocase protein TatC [Saprospiraceae bacterium]|nr:MAG: Sec-independent protein translocase protein TatC [Saprospiraceae bacterium]